MELEIIKAVFEEEEMESVFEVGCSEGGLLEDICRKKRVVVGGLDTKESYMEAVRGKFPEYRDNFFVYNAQNNGWPVQDKQYDVAFSMGSLMYMINPITPIQEMMRIAKRVIIVEPSDAYAGELGRFIGRDHHGVQFTRNYPSLMHFLGNGSIRLKHFEDKLIIKTI